MQPTPLPSPRKVSPRLWQRSWVCLDPAEYYCPCQQRGLCRIESCSQPRAPMTDKQLYQRALGSLLHLAQQCTRPESALPVSALTPYAVTNGGASRSSCGHCEIRWQHCSEGHPPVMTCGGKRRSKGSDALQILQRARTHEGTPQAGLSPSMGERNHGVARRRMARLPLAIR
jgi:hypothetical protein